MIIKSDGVGATSIIRGMLAFLEPRNEQNVLGSGEHNSKEIEISEHMGLFHAEIHTQIRLRCHDVFNIPLFTQKGLSKKYLQHKSHHLTTTFKEKKTHKKH